jgi:ribose transport system ATP-binding protein
VTPLHPLLDARDIRKSFPGVKALDGVSLSVGRGEVLAVIGENGAGKSTFMKILAGIYMPDDGSLQLDGQPIHFANVADSLRCGIVLIHQELNLAENLSVSANLFLGRERLRGVLLGWLDRRTMTEEAHALLAKVGLDVSPNQKVADLSPGQKQLVEIARALSLSAKLIIMDEPTSSLTQSETDRLYQVIDDLKKSGVAVVYISHRLGEVRRVADRVVVLRDGRNSGTLAKTEINHESMVQLMVGRDLKQFYSRKHSGPNPNKPVRLEVRKVCYEGGPGDSVSFTLKGGEIVGMAGLVGAGRTEFAEALFGIRRIAQGEVLLDGRPFSIHHPRQAIDRGLLLAPEDRRLHGLILQDSVQRNLSLPDLKNLSLLRFVLPKREKAVAQQLCDQLRVKTPRLTQAVGLLSGGNQQKVVVGKWLEMRPKVLIFDEPTRGVDVGARSEIYALMDQLAANGVAILMISSDLEEILGMSDRVLVMHEGRLAGEIPRAQLSEQAVMHLATGGQDLQADRPKSVCSN